MKKLRNCKGACAKLPEYEAFVSANGLTIRPYRIGDEIKKLPKKYIINDKATILIWSDNTKTIIKRSVDDKYDKRIAFLTAYFQKWCGLSKNKANQYLKNLEDEESLKEDK